MLIMVVLSVLVTVACGDKDESVQNIKSDKVVSVDTPFSVPKQLSPQPSPVGNQIPIETPVPVQSVPSGNPTGTASGLPAVNVATFLDLMDKALTEGYTYQTQLDITVLASLGVQQQESTVVLNGISDGINYDASLKVDGSVPINIRGISDRTFAKEPNIADIWRELPKNQDVINAPEIITSSRGFLRNPSMVGLETMGGVDTHHMNAVLDGELVGRFIGVLLGTEGELESDFWIEAETVRIVRLTVTGQTVGKENPDLLIDVDVALSAWDFGRQVEILVPPLPPPPSKQQWDSQPEMTLMDDRDYKAVIKVYEKGEIVVDLYEKLSPITVNNFVFLSEEGFYNGVSFHRVIPDFMAQTGDPTGSGSGGPGYKFQNEFHPDARHDGAGVLSMANSGVQNGSATNGSQFFITYKDTSFLDGLNSDTSPKDCSAQGVSCHSVFGRVTAGMEVLQSITLRDPAVGGYADVIESITILTE